MDVRRYALATSIVVAALCGMAVPASAMPNMPHLYASQVSHFGGDVAHLSKHRRGYSGGYGPSSRWYPE